MGEVPDGSGCGFGLQLEVAIVMCLITEPRLPYLTGIQYM